MFELLGFMLDPSDSAAQCIDRLQAVSAMKAQLAAVEVEEIPDHNPTHRGLSQARLVCHACNIDSGRDTQEFAISKPRALKCQTHRQILLANR